MLMHHHRPKVDGHFDGLIAMRPGHRAQRSTEEDQGFNWSHWSPLSVGYSLHTALAAAIVNFLCERNCAGGELKKSLCTRSTISFAKCKLRGRCKQQYSRARGELSFEPLDAYWAWVEACRRQREWSSSKNGRVSTPIPWILLIMFEGMQSKKNSKVVSS